MNGKMGIVIPSRQFIMRYVDRVYIKDGRNMSFPRWNVYGGSLMMLTSLKHPLLLSEGDQHVPADLNNE